MLLDWCLVWFWIWWVVCSVTSVVVLLAFDWLVVVLLWCGFYVRWFVLNMLFDLLLGWFAGVVCDYAVNSVVFPFLFCGLLFVVLALV